jgi:hypothetical protein
MSNTADILRQINQLRVDALRKAYANERLSPDYTLEEHLASLVDLEEDDRQPCAREYNGGVDLGDPNQDWCVNIQGDTVRVFAAGDIVVAAVIVGAGAL